MIPPETLIEACDHGPVRVLSMTGRSRGNALSRQLEQAVCAAVEAAEADERIRVLVLCGTEKHFSVGADLNEVACLHPGMAIASGWLDNLDRLRRSRKPLVAAVRGHAVGGGFELALCCDLIVAAEDARFALPETGIGVIAGQGGTQRLMALCGRAIASDLILTGRTLSGREACDFGIAARAVPAENVLAEALTVAQAIAGRSELAVAFAREILFEASEGPLRQSFRIERLLAALVLDTPEARRRVGDFLNRRNSPAANPSSTRSPDKPTTGE